MDAQYISLFDLQKQMREGIEEFFPDRLWVCAEVASVQVKANGHCYLDLCQSEDGRVVAKAKAVIWRNRYLPISMYFREMAGSDIAAGMQLLVRVQVTYSELYGLTLTVDEVEPQFTIGAAELEKRRTIARLEEDGLMDAQKELAMPALPYRLAVISARDAAGYGDFCRHLTQNEYGFVFDVHLFEAAMQGKDAPESITDALEAVECSEEHFDAVLIMRGGGSALDLACFDDYGLCFAIANSTIPVCTAIGHERDRHVADMVAWQAVKTPTALADLFIGVFAAEDELITSFSTRLRLAFAGKISALSSRLDVLQSRIKAADPRSILARGYLLATDSSGVVLKKAAGVESGDRISVMFADGTLKCTVDGKV